MLVDDRIGFLVHTWEIANHYKNVWRLLPPESFDIVLYGDADTSEGLPADCTPWKTNLVSAKVTLAAKQRYKILVSPHPIDPAGPTPLIKMLGEINVRFLYAAGKFGWNMREWNQLYDVIMCFGPYHAAQFARICAARVVEMGYPRFDPYFTNPFDREATLSRFGCDPTKKTVVWLPTWLELSSIGWFDEEVSTLSRTYNVVVKVHPLMPGSEPERVQALLRHPFTHVITDATDNLPLYQMADYMLFDYGGPPFAGIYTDKKMLLLNVPNADLDELAGANSPDIQLRKHIVSVQHTEKCIVSLLEDDSHWEAQQDVRRKLRDTYFAPFYGTSSNVAADFLMGLG